MKQVFMWCIGIAVVFVLACAPSPTPVPPTPIPPTQAPPTPTEVVPPDAEQTPQGRAKATHVVPKGDNAGCEIESGCDAAMGLPATGGGRPLAQQFLLVVTIVCLAGVIGIIIVVVADYFRRIK